MKRKNTYIKTTRNGFMVTPNQDSARFLVHEMTPDLTSSPVNYRETTSAEIGEITNAFRLFRNTGESDGYHFKKISK
jgi:hypothetical protein